MAKKKAKRKKKPKPAKGRVLRILKDLYEEEAHPKQIEQVVDGLIEEGAPLNEVLLAELQKNDPEFNLFISDCIRAIDDPSIVDDLEDIFWEGDDLTDHTRSIILSLMTQFGVDTSSPDYFEKFDDINEVLDESLTIALAGIEDDEQNLAEYIEFLDQMEPFSQAVHLVSMIERIDSLDAGQRGAFELMKYVSWSDRELLAEICIKYLSRLGADDSVQAVLQLANYHQSPNIRAIARGFVHSEKPLTQITPDSASIAKLGAPCRAALSAIDGMGSRVLWVIRRVGRQFNAANFVLNLKTGVKDAFGLIAVRKSEVDSIVEEFEENMPTVDVDYDYAKLVFSEAMSKNGEHTPSIIHFWRHHAFEMPLYPKEVAFAFEDEIDWDRIRNDQDLYACTHMIIDDAAAIEWFIHNEDVYDFVDDYYDVIEDCDENEPAYLAMLRDAEHAIFLPEKEFFQDLLLKTAEIKHIEGSEIVRDLMLSAHIHLQEADAELVSQPFVKEVIELTIDRVYENIAHGYDLRENPEAFEL